MTPGVTQMLTTRIAVYALALAVCAVPAAAGWEEGVAAYRSGDFGRAIEEFQGVVGSSPDYAGGHMMLGQSLLKAGRAQEAVASLRKAYDLNPGDVSTQVALATAFVKANRYNEAATLLSRIDVGSLPSSQQASVNKLKAVALAKSGNTSSALSALADAVARNPNDANAQYQYGVMLYNAGQTSQAVAALERAVSLNADAKSLEALADAALRLGREERSDSGKRSAYSKAVNAASRLVSTNASYDNLMLLGGAQLGAKDYSEAISTFERAASANSRDWLPRYYVGQAQMKLGNFPAAARSLQESLNMTSDRSNTVKIWSQLGLVFEKQKNWDQARTAYEKAGDTASIARVNQNEETEQYNEDIERQQAEAEAIREEEERIRQELEELEGGGR